MKMLKKDPTVGEHLKTIQSDGGKARWAKLTPEQRNALARKIVGARWAKKQAAELAVACTARWGGIQVDGENQTLTDVLHSMAQSDRQDRSRLLIVVLRSESLGKPQPLGSAE